MLYVALFDPTPSTSRALTFHLQTQRGLPEHVRVHEFRTFDSLREAMLGKRHFHLVILQDLMSPFSDLTLARTIRSMDTAVPIVVSTKNPELSLDGYDIPLFRFYTQALSSSDARILLASIMSMPSERHGRFFVFCNNNGIFQIKLSDICYFESNKSQLYLHTNDNDCFYFHNSIANLETKLRRYHFQRVHKSFLVNLNYVSCIHGDVVDLRTGASLPLSKHKASTVRKYMLELMESYK